MEEKNLKDVEHNNDVEKTTKEKSNKSLIIVLITIIIVLLVTVSITLGLLFNGENPQNSGNNVENTAENKLENQIENVVENKIPQENNSNNEVLENTKKVVSVKETLLEKNMIIKAFDSQGNIIWTYTTPEWTIQPLNMGQKLIGTKNNKVYLCDWGNLYVLDMQTGKIISCDTETNIGGAGKCIFDNENNLYITSYLAPLSKFDENGKKKASTFALWDNGLYDINKMTIEKNELIAYSTDGGYAKLKLDDLSIISIVPDTRYVAEYIKIIDKAVNDSSDSDIICDLIYFNNDNIPDLVISSTKGCVVSLYMYENGKVYTLLDNASYGYGGCKYYDYLEKKGTAYTYGNSYAGAIGTKTLLILNSRKEFDTLSVTDMGADVEKTNPDYEEIQKALEKEKGWYYNGEKISEQEFNNKLKQFSLSFDEKDHKVLEGRQSVDEIKRQLQQ